MGYKEFDKDINLSGIIVNNVSSRSHYDCIKSSIEDTCSIPVLGYLKKDKEIIIPERHLGLVPSEENGCHSVLYERLGKMALETVDIDGLLKAARSSDVFPDYDKSIFLDGNVTADVNLAIAKDNAFCFYYQDDIDLFESMGAKIKYFSPLSDRHLPDDIDGIFLGGGFLNYMQKSLWKMTV